MNTTYSRVPIWIIYRSAVLPFEVFQFEHGNHATLLESQMPVPKLTIRKLIKKGVEWVYVKQADDALYRKYLLMFLSDPSAAVWIAELCEQNKLEQLEFPKGITMPHAIQSLIKQARDGYLQQQNNVDDIITTTQYAQPATEKKSSPQLKVEATEKLNYEEMAEKIRSFKNSLVMVSADYGETFDSVDTAYTRYFEISSLVTYADIDTKQKERFQHIEDLFHDLKSDKNWQSHLTEVINELTDIEIQIVAQKMQRDQPSASRPVAPGSISDENRQLRGQIDELKKEIGEIQRQYVQLYEDYDQVLKKGTNEAVSSATHLNISELEDKVKSLEKENFKSKIAMANLKAKNEDMMKKLKAKKAS